MTTRIRVNHLLLLAWILAVAEIIQAAPPAAPDASPQEGVIGKYEVTRGQYRKFMEAGGYEDSRYWSAEGWKWKESDVIDYAGMNGSVAHTVRPHANEKRREPEHWAAEQEWIGHGQGHPGFTQTDNHPVVGLTYYEAEAYCKWAGGPATRICCARPRAGTRANCRSAV